MQVHSLQRDCRVSDHIHVASQAQDPESELANCDLDIYRREAANCSTNYAIKTCLSGNCPTHSTSSWKDAQALSGDWEIMLSCLLTVLVVLSECRCDPLYLH